jgi:membrane protease YdiL (CAAX protease family)
MSAILNDSLAPVLVPPEVLSQVPSPAAEPTPASPRPAPGFWGALGWVFVWFLVCGLIPGFAAGLTAGITGQPLSHLLELALLAGQVMGAALAVFLLHRRLGRGWVAEVGLNRLPLIPVVLVSLSVPGVRVILIGIVLLLGALFGAQDPTVSLVAQTAGSLPWWLCVTVIAVGPAINEELWFRGFLGRGLVGRYGPTLGILLTSLLFGLAHLHPVQAAYAAVMGVWLHLTYRATRSLWVPILGHFLNNGMAVAVALLSTAIPAEESAANGKMTTLVISGVALAVLAAASWGLYRLRVRSAEPAR